MTTLGICIPTYKRPDFLERCVMSAIKSADSRPIKIFISDDSCSNTNDFVIDKLTSLYNFIVINRNQNNQGIDQNIQTVVDMCNCDYAWLIGEDDEFVFDGIKKMYDLIQDTSLPFIFSSYYYASEDHSKIYEKIEIGTNNLFVLDADDFIQNYLWSIGFIGSVVVSRKAWDQTSRNHYIGTYFTHVGRIIEMLNINPSVLINNFASVSNRIKGDDTFTWKSDSFGVFLGFERLCKLASIQNKLFKNHLEIAALNYRKRSGYLSFKTTFRLRSEGAFDISQFLKYVLFNVDIDVFKKVWLLIISLTPRTLFIPLIFLYKRFS